MVRALLPLSFILAGCTPTPQEASMSDPTPEKSSEPLASTHSGVPNDTPVAAEGRRILSTAIVRIGPDSHLTVELRDGRVLVLRNVTVGAGNYCGEFVSGAPGGKKFCGDFADVSAARPGGGPMTGSPDQATGEPIKPAPASTKQE